MIGDKEHGDLQMEEPQSIDQKGSHACYVSSISIINGILKRIVVPTSILATSNGNKRMTQSRIDHRSESK
jgi:hypothetical protein